MTDYSCCVCGEGQAEISVLLEKVLGDLFACPNHCLKDVVRSRPFSDRVRRITLDYYRENLVHVTTVVWASRASLKFRPLVPRAVIDVPNQLRVVVLPDDAWPQLIAVDNVLASVLLSMRRSTHMSAEEKLRSEVVDVRGEIRCREFVVGLNKVSAEPGQTVKLSTKVRSDYKIEEILFPDVSTWGRIELRRVAVLGEALREVQQAPGLDAVMVLGAISVSLLLRSGQTIEIFVKNISGDRQEIVAALFGLVTDPVDGYSVDAGCVSVEPGGVARLTARVARDFQLEGIDFAESSIGKFELRSVSVSDEGQSRRQQLLADDRVPVRGVLQVSLNLSAGQTVEIVAKNVARDESRLAAALFGTYRLSGSGE
jgi:hypothetical protein